MRSPRRPRADEASGVGRSPVAAAHHTSPIDVDDAPPTMHPSLRLANAHKPLIRFLGKRQWPKRQPHVLHLANPGANARARTQTPRSSTRTRSPHPSSRSVSPSLSRSSRARPPPPARARRSRAAARAGPSSRTSGRLRRITGSATCGTGRST